MKISRRLSVRLATGLVFAALLAGCSGGPPTAPEGPDGGDSDPGDGSSTGRVVETRCGTGAFAC